MCLTSCEGTLDDVFGEWSRPSGNNSQSNEKPSEPTMMATPLTLEAITAGTIVVKNPQAGMKYSLNGGAKQTVTTDAITVAVGDKVAFYGKGTSISCYGSTDPSNCTKIAGGTAEVKVYGNIMSLLDETGFATASTLPATEYTFYELFSGNDMLKDANGLLLPAETLPENCYSLMFKDCKSLTAAPALPAEMLEAYCYASMFEGCTSLTTAPELPATTVPGFCYQSMFEGCTSLTTAPKLSATEVGNSSCYSMFQGCTSLTTAPELKATTLADYCYRSMFSGCTSLNAVTCLATNITATKCTESWLDGAGTDASVTSRTLHIKTGQDPADTNWNLSTSGDGSSKKWTAVADR